MNPSTYTQSLADEIVDWVSEGKPLRAYCRQAGKPGKSTITDWRKAHPEFDEAFKVARGLGADALAEEALMIADTPMLGEIVRESEKEGRTVTQEDMLGHRKLQVETRLKLLAKWFPTKYGDKIDVNHGGKVDASLTVSFVGGKPGESGDPVP